MGKAKRKGGWLGVSIMMVIMSVVYAISPVDLIPDAPVVGWLDDAAVMLGSISALLAALPKRKKELAGDAEGE
ncbi:MAG: YkvA family protein [Myxococcota bacterium]